MTKLRTTAIFDKYGLKKFCCNVIQFYMIQFWTDEMNLDEIKYIALSCDS